MDNENRTPQDTNTSEATFSHSGSSLVPESMREQPVHEFPQDLHEVVGESEDKPVSPTLPEGVTTEHFDLATSEYSGTTQEGSSATEQSGVQPESSATTFTPETKPRKKKLLLSLSLATAGLLVAGGAALGISSAVSANGSKNEPPKADPKTPVATPTSEASPSNNPEAELTVQSLEIPTGLTPDAYGKQFAEVLVSKWAMAGATKENEMATVKAGDNSSAFLSGLADKNGDTFADAILVPNWRDNEALVSWVNAMKAINKDTLDNHFKTDLLGQEPYTFGSKVESTTVDSQNSNEKQLTTQGIQLDNAANNQAGQIEPNLLELNNKPFSFTYTVTVVDGKDKISSIVSQ